VRAERPDWLGRTVVCIASGPSLTAEDCDAVRAAGYPAIVTNSSFRRAPWAAILFGYDSRWWKAHMAEVQALGFSGRMLCASPIAANFGVETVHNAPWLRSYPNSGACAIAIAIAAGARRVVLLGFDCAPAPSGRMHWHEDHPPTHGMTNCASIQAWPRHFRNVQRDAEAAGVEVVNASRVSALRGFARGALADAL
jgi:hypothetical protein